MPQKKRTRILISDDDDEEDDKPTKLQRCLLTTINRNNLENLSNELFYEIFEYLDDYDIYKAFFNVNIRFQHLILNSTLPIKMNISHLSKSTFEQYYIHFIIPNQHRIHSIHLSDPFTAELIFPLTDHMSIFSHLEALILNYIEPKYLDNLLLYLASLPDFKSLSILFSHDSNPNILCDLIFDLPVLKYCKMTFEKSCQFTSLPVSTNKSRSIEHLVINGKCNLNEVSVLLSYVPQLSHLSVNYSGSNYIERLDKTTVVLNKLTHLFLRLNSTCFNQFEIFIKNLFHHLQVLHFSTNYDRAYLDADRWKQLILSHIPRLQIFGFIHANRILHGYRDESMYQPLLKKFTSSFWMERQWFFEHDPNYEGHSYGIFYSIQPYRGKNFKLIDRSDADEYSNHIENVIHSVQHVVIENGQIIEDCLNYFPNARELTLSYYYPHRYKWPETHDFQLIIPLTQLTTLTIDNANWNFNRLIEILNLTPNIHTLKFKTIRLSVRAFKSLHKNETFQLVSRKCKIKKMIINQEYSFKILKVFTTLCPELQHLTIGTSKKSLEPTVRFFLSKTNKTTCHLSSLCIFGIRWWVDRLKNLLQSVRIVNNYSIKVIEDKFYIWW